MTTDHYREAEQHLAHARECHGRLPESERVHLGYAQAHATLTLIDELRARPHVDIAVNPDAIDVTTFVDRANGEARYLLDGKEVTIKEADR